MKSYIKNNDTSTVNKTTARVHHANKVDYNMNRMFAAIDVVETSAHPNAKWECLSRCGIRWERGDHEVAPQDQEKSVETMLDHAMQHRNSATEVIDDER